MRTIRIAGTELAVKDYHCAACEDLVHPGEDSSYEKKTRMGLWLYVNVTDRCNANCPFCVSQATRHGEESVRLSHFQAVLEEIRDSVSGVSFTGGEPMLFPELTDSLIDSTDRILGPHVEIDIVTNGTNLDALAAMKSIDRLTTIHISRHHDDDEVNRQLMQWHAPPAEEIRQLTSRIRHPQRVVFNCVLQKQGISTPEAISRYLDFAIDAGVHNNSFITMMKANAFCVENALSPCSLPFMSPEGCRAWNDSHPDALFDVWNYHKDHRYCSCLSGGYLNKKGRTRFYFRCPGEENAPPYCRQLVYTASNILQDGFGNNRQQIL